MLVKLDDVLCNPERAFPSSAGADLKSVQEIVVYPGENKTISTGISVKIPYGHVGLVFSRSGMGKVGVTLANSVGVIDAEYRGLIKLMVVNHGDAPFHIKKYDRIGQLVIVPIISPDFISYEGTEEAWNDTERGTGGFGSTGKQ